MWKWQQHSTYENTTNSSAGDHEDVSTSAFPVPSMARKVWVTASTCIQLVRPCEKDFYIRSSVNVSKHTFKSIQWTIVGALQNWAGSPPAKANSGRVPIVIYIRLPMPSRYGNCLGSQLDLLLLSVSPSNTVQYFMAVCTRALSWTWKRMRTSFAHLSWLRQSFRSGREREVYSPKQCFASPRFFVWNPVQGSVSLQLFAILLFLAERKSLAYRIMIKTSFPFFRFV